MIGETRAQVLERVGANRSDDKRELSRRLAAIFFQYALGDDEGRPFTAEDDRAVRAAFQEQIDLIVPEAGYTSADEMEAAQ